MSRSDPMSASQDNPDVSAKESRFQRLLEEAGELPVKSRLRLLDALKAGMVVESNNGLRFSVESLSEYKRARRSMALHEPVVKWIESFGVDDVFYDVGANTGALSLLAAQVHKGRVPIIAFEPAFDTFGALVRNVFANDFAMAITPLHVALFDRTGIEPLHRSSLGGGTALHAVGEAIDYRRQPFIPVAVEHVLAFRLDDLVRTCALPLPTRLKLDVDGFENKVLAGATEVLTSSRCDVYTELVEAHERDPHPREVVAWLQGLGYELAQEVDHRPAGEYPRMVDALFVRR
jgi:FkbM family methyltransferase